MIQRIRAYEDLSFIRLLPVSIIRTELKYLQGHTHCIFIIYNHQRISHFKESLQTCWISYNHFCQLTFLLKNTMHNMHPRTIEGNPTLYFKLSNDFRSRAKENYFHLSWSRVTSKIMQLNLQLTCKWQQD